MAPLPHPSPLPVRTGGLLVIAILMVGLNLRPILAAIGPLLDDIQQATGLGDGSAGLLTTLPVLAMGCGALTGAVLQRHLGALRGVSVGMVLIAIACAFRGGWSTGDGLIVTAAIGGVGIALVQALLPAVIKGRFPDRVGPLMGLYTTGIMAGGAIGAASAAPLAGAITWSLTLALWGLPAVLALILWKGVTAPLPADPHPPATIPLPIRSRRAWLLMLFFGIATGGYTLVLAWLPPYYTGLGWSSTTAGLLLGGLTLTEVVAGLVISAVIGRFPDRRPLLIGVLLLMLAGLLCLMLAPSTLVVPAVLLSGLGIGALFPLSLIVAMDAVDTPHRAGALMGFVQGGGYIIASTMPLVAGLIRQYAADLSQAWGVMVAGTVLLLLIALTFAPAAPESRKVTPGK